MQWFFSTMRTFPINYTLVLCLLAQMVGYAQSPNKIDSLWGAYHNSANNQEKIEALKELSSAYLYNEVDSSIVLLSEMKTLAEASSDDKALLNYYQIMALAHHRLTRNKQALACIDTAILLCRQLGDSIKVASNLINKGAIYQQMGKPEEAIRAQHTVIRMMEGKEEGKELRAKALHNTGVNYSDMGLQTEALDYLFKALEIKLEQESALSLLSTYSTIANIYQERENYDKAQEYYRLGSKWAEASGSQYHQAILNVNFAANYLEAGELEQADSLLRITEATSRSINSPFVLMHTQLTQGELAIERKNYEQATQLLEQCHQFSSDQQLPYGQGYALLNLAKVDQATGNYRKGIDHAEQALDIFLKHQFTEQIASTQQLISELYAEMGDYRQALVYQQYYQAYQDSVYNTENSTIIAGMQMEHDLALEEKDYQLQLAQKEKSLEQAQAKAQRWYLLTIALVALLLLVILVLLYLNFRKQQDSKEELAKINKELYDANEKLEIAYLDLSSTNQQLNIKNDKLQQFSFSAYHDFKESLRNMSSYSQLLSKQLSNSNQPQAVKDYINQIVTNGDGMCRMLENLVEYSNGEGKEQRKEKLDLGTQIENLKERWNKQTDHIPLDISFSFEGPAPKLFADSAQIEQLFSNLIDNAVKYKQAEVPLKIELGTLRNKKRLIFYVKDNGMGIDENFHDRIFDPFFRLHGRHISGAGMGLAIAKQIVKSYQGSIWLESSPGNGTTFFFTLPAAVYASEVVETE